jgi:hypothetical protein
MSETEGGEHKDPAASASGTIELVKRAAQDGASDAREAAARTWSSVSLFVSRFVYTTCYTVSYGVVFPSALLAHSIPKNNAAVQGLIDGAQAAIRSVDRLGGQAIDPMAPATAPALAPA